MNKIAYHEIEDNASFDLLVKADSIPVACFTANKKHKYRHLFFLKGVEV